MAMNISSEKPALQLVQNREQEKDWTTTEILPVLSVAKNSNCFFVTYDPICWCKAQL